MILRHPNLASATLLGAVFSLASVILAGCASPGPPRPPSLRLPTPAKNVEASRRGNTVALRFVLPYTATEGLPLKSATITATACRALGHEPCRPIAVSHTFPVPQAGVAADAELIDTLPPELTAGPLRLLQYRVQLANDRGKAAGFSDPAYTAAGTPPAAVAGLQAQGSRLGVVLTWQGVPDDGSRVLLHREDLNPAAAKPAGHETKAQPQEAKPKRRHTEGRAEKSSPAKGAPIEPPNTALLATGEESGKPQGTATLDTSALTDEPYRYTAERKRTLELDGRSIELRSTLSAPVDFTLHDVYPPPAPTDLAVAGYSSPTTTDATGKYAADLIWQPVDDPSLAGYNIYRETLGAGQSTTSKKVRLNAKLITVPGFHDESANPHVAYRYSVTAIDKKGNESAAATAMLSPQ